MFGNLLENAVEACGRQSSGERYIRLWAGPSLGTYSITVENSFEGDPRREGSGFLSSKGPRMGVGVSSVRATAKKYGGRAVFEAEAGLFRASVILHG